MMNNQGAATSIRSKLVFAQGAGVFVCALGGVALIGWWLNNETLKCIVPGSTPLKPNIGTGLFLCGAALVLSSRRKIDKLTGTAIALIALLVVALAAATLVEDFFNWNLGIDHWLVPTTGAVSPGRMLPTTAFCFVVMGAALFAETELVPRRLGFPLVAGLSATLVMIGVLALGGFSLEKLIGPRWNLLGMSVSGITASVGFMMLGSGLLAFLQSKGELTWSLNALTTAGFAFGILLMVIAAAISFNFTLRLQKTAVEVAHTQEILKEIEEVEVNLLDLESGQRGYIITGDQAVLEERKSAETEVQNHLGILRKLVSDDPLQKLRLGQVESLIGQRIAWGDEAMLIRQQHGFSAAQEMIATGTGHALVKKCRRVFGDMEQAGYERLSQRQKRSEATSQTAFLLLPLGMFLSLAILSLGLFFLNAGIRERTQSEKALRENEERMRAVLESAMDCVITMDHHGRIVEFNRAAEKTFGYRRSEAIDRSLAELIIPPSLRESHTRGLSHYLATGIAPVLGRRIELMAMRAGGTEFPVELAITRIGSQDPPLFTGFIRDIAERKRADDALRASEAQLQTVVENLDEGVVVSDLKGDLLHWNRAALEIHGFTELSEGRRQLTELVDTFELFTLDGAPVPVTQWPLARILRGEDLRGLELRVRNLKIDRQWVFEYGGTLVHDASGQPLMAIVTINDISERKRAEETLRQQAALFDQAYDAVLVWDWNGSITFWNRGAERLYGFTKAEATGRSPHQIFNTKVVGGVQTFFRSLDQTGVWEGELEQITKDGREITVESRMVLIRSPKREYVLETNRDVTERKQAQETAKRLREAEEEQRVAVEASRVKNEFLAMMSHELRTPLNAVIGFTGTMLMELPGPITPEQKKQLETIKSSARHQLSLINDLLDLAKIESGRFKLRLEPIACDEIVREVAETLRPTAASKALGFQVDLPSGATMVQADNRALKQILINLINNAIKFTDKGEVRIAVRAENGKIEIAIKDTGDGISVEDQTKLFKPFSRLDRGSRREEGTGLGLHLSRQLATLLGGQIVIESQPGKGSTFTLILGGVGRDSVEPETVRPQMDGLTESRPTKRAAEIGEQT